MLKSENPQTFITFPPLRHINRLANEHGEEPRITADPCCGTTQQSWRTVRLYLLKSGQYDPASVVSNATSKQCIQELTVRSLPIRNIPLIFSFKVNQVVSVHDKKAWRGGEGELHSTSALDEGEWSAYRLDRLTPRYVNPSIHYLGGWVDPRTGMDNSEMRKIPFTCWESKHDSSVVQPAAFITIRTPRFLHCCDVLKLKNDLHMIYPSPGHNHNNL